MEIVKRVTESPKGLTYEVVVNGVNRWAKWVPWEAGQRARDDAAREQEHEAARVQPDDGSAVDDLQ